MNKALEAFKAKHPAKNQPKYTSLDEWMAAHPRTHAVSDDVLKGQREVESAGNDYAKSKAGAIGPMQVIPKAQNLDPKVVADPKTNLEIGARIMDKLHKQFGGDITRALRAYNQGAKNERNRDIEEMPKEATQYPGKVLQKSMKYETGTRPDAPVAMAQRHPAQVAPMPMESHWYDPIVGLAAKLGLGYNTPTDEGKK